MTLYRQNLINAYQQELKKPDPQFSTVIGNAMYRTELQSDEKDRSILEIQKKIFTPYYRYYLAEGPLAEPLMVEFKLAFMKLMLDFLKNDSYQAIEQSSLYPKFKELQTEISRDMDANPNKYIPEDM